jgi:hypothetical protein
MARGWGGVPVYGFVGRRAQVAPWTDSFDALALEDPVTV